MWVIFNYILNFLWKGSTHLYEFKNGDETFDQVYVLFGSAIDQIEFLSNQGNRFGPFGGKFGGTGVTNSEFLSHKGCRLHHVSGKSGIFQWVGPWLADEKILAIAFHFIC